MKPTTPLRGRKKRTVKKKVRLLGAGETAWSAAILYPGYRIFRLSRDDRRRKRDKGPPPPTKAEKTFFFALRMSFMNTGRIALLGGGGRKAPGG